jgi:hypothetical protein
MRTPDNDRDGREMETCHGCTARHPVARMKQIDVSLDDEYYPRVRHLCPTCANRGESE